MTCEEILAAIKALSEAAKIPEITHADRQKLVKKILELASLINTH